MAFTLGSPQRPKPTALAQSASHPWPGWAWTSPPDRARACVSHAASTGCSHSQAEGLPWEAGRKGAPGGSNLEAPAAQSGQGQEPPPPHSTSCLSVGAGGSCWPYGGGGGRQSPSPQAQVAQGQIPKLQASFPMVSPKPATLRPLVAPLVRARQEPWVSLQPLPHQGPLLEASFQ